MKTQKETRTMDELGRIVLPQAMREMLKLKPGDKIDLSCEEPGYITLVPVKEHCTLCGSEEGVTRVENSWVCMFCRQKIKALS